MPGQGGPIFIFFLKDIENEGGWLFQIFRFLDLLASMAKTMIFEPFTLDFSLYYSYGKL